MRTHTKTTTAKALVINGVVLHPDVTIELVVDAIERQMSTLDNPGFCIACGEEAFECEPDARRPTPDARRPTPDARRPTPDARRHECEACGEQAVYGAAELLQHFPI
jgi:hypothetical protein